MLVFMLGSILHFWKPTIVPFTGLIGLISLFKNSVMAAKPEAWEPVKRRLERAELPTLLDALALNILPLSDAIRAGLTTQLSTATTDILEALTPAQRKQLVRFVPAQLNCSVWTRPIGPIQPLSAEKVQAATVGLLALATLRQTGAETLDWRGVDRVTSNLMAAHDEYLASLSRA